MANVIYTVGHSTRTSDEFISLLRTYGIETVVDARTIPRSRHNPQFNADELRAALSAGGITYVYLAGLGGLRHTTKDSVNTAWKNASFRGYADHMQTQEFRDALAQLIALAAETRCVIMCAEAVPWRCHRSLIGDALLVRGVAVQDILSATSCKPHKLTPWAKVEGDRITYPAV
ncbi:MAG: DUF488 domain-containing protein [Chloroflexi bacterium]|nr:DUF488 domain-containing protein [Chloroflexota bacterium]MCL5276141.1 DUF488 domain-containing protein [Chloroflexota bacterium]